MKTLISDQELLDYISGQLDKEETKELYRKAVLNGESDLLLNVDLANLATQEELADDLLGPDDFEVEENQTKFVSFPQSSFGIAAKSPINLKPKKEK